MINSSLIIFLLLHHNHIIFPAFFNISCTKYVFSTRNTTKSKFLPLLAQSYVKAVTNLIYHFKRIFYCTYRFTAIFPITINTATRTILTPLYNFFIKKTYRAYHASTSIRCIVLSTLYGLFKPQS